jgi:hypothetical protein
MEPNPDVLWGKLPLEIKVQVLGYLSPQQLAQVSMVDQQSNAEAVLGWEHEMIRLNNEFESAIQLAPTDMGAQWQLTATMNELAKIVRSMPSLVPGIGDWSGHPVLYAQYERFLELIERARAAAPDLVPDDPIAKVEFDF